MIAFH
jgi:hypothetical protein